MSLLSFAHRFLSWGRLVSRDGRTRLTFRSLGIARRSSRRRPETAGVEANRMRAGRVSPSRMSVIGDGQRAGRGRGQSRRDRWSWGKRRSRRGTTRLTTEALESRSMLALTIGPVTDNVLQQIGALTDGSLTNDSDLTVTVNGLGAYAAPFTVYLYNGTTLINSKSIPSAASSTTIQTTALLDGPVSLTAKVLADESAPFTAIIDTAKPEATITSNKTSVGGSQTALITFSLSEPSTTFGVGDVSVTGGALSNFNGSGASYTATFTPNADSTADGQISVPAGVFTDEAGNTNTASSTKTITVDTVAPTVVVTSDKASVNGSQTATITFTLSKASTNFTAGDVTVTNGTLSGFAVTPAGGGIVANTVFTATFAPTASFTGAASVTVAAGKFTDSFGNPNIEGATSIGVNTQAPTVTVTSNRSTLRAGQTATITFTLSAATSDFVKADVVVGGGTISDLTKVSSKVYTAVFTPATPSTVAGTIVVPDAVFTDASGNGNLGGALATPIAIDTVIPTVAITSNKTSVGGSQTALITFSLGKPSTNFLLGDVLVTGGKLSDFTAFGTTTYTAIFTPDADSTTPGAITVPANAFTDEAGNPNDAASLAPPITVDTLAPTVTVTSDKSSIGGTQTATITFTLSDPSTDFSDNDVTVTGGTLSTLTVTPSVGGVPVANTVFTATFTPQIPFAGKATVTVLAGGFTDAAGNANTAGSTSIDVETSLPTVTITSSAASLRIGQTAIITFELSEPSTNFTGIDPTATGGTLTGFAVKPGTAVANTVFTATFTPTDNSTDPGTITVPAGVFTDALGNANAGGQLAPSISIDTQRPTIVTVTSSKPDGSYGAGTVIPIEVVFSEAVTVVGSPTLALNVTGRTAAFDQAVGNRVFFNYVVAAGDNVGDLDYASATALTGAVVTDAAGNAAASLALNYVGGVGDLGAAKAIRIDTMPPATPTVDRLVTPNQLPTITGTATLNAGETLTIRIRDNTNALIAGAVYDNVTPDALGVWSLDLDNTPTQAGNFLAPLVSGTYSVQATVQDAAGNTVDDLTFKELIVGAGVQFVTANVADGSYGVGSKIGIQVVFSEAVVVAIAVDAPTLSLAVGQPRVATYVSGSGTRKLLFEYEVKAGDSTLDLDYDSITALNLKFATIKAGANDASITLPVPGAVFSLGDSKNIEIDTTPPVNAPTVDPVVTNVKKPTLTGTAILDPGETVTVTINGYEFTNVPVDGFGIWTLNTATAKPVAGTFVNLADGVYDVQAAIVDGAGNEQPDVTIDELEIDTVAAKVLTVTSPDADGVYTAGATITIEVQFDEFLTYNFGAPTLRLNTTPTARSAGFVGDAFSALGTVLVFEYVVQPRDTAADLDYASTTALVRNGLSLTDLAGNEAVLTLPAPGSADSLAGNKDIEIDTTPPAAPTVDNPVVTNDTTPTLTGGATLAVGESLTVTVGGFTFPVAVVAGRWTLNTGTTPSTPAGFAGLADGTYDVVATARDAAGNTEADGTTNELVIDTVAPAPPPTVNALRTNVQRPTLTGTATLAVGDTLSVRVNGFTYVNVPAPGGAWSLNLATATPVVGTFPNLPEGVYEVVATVTDRAGNAVSDVDKNELTIDLTPPTIAPTVNPLTTNDRTPVLSGTAVFREPGDSLRVVVNGFTFANVPVFMNAWTLDTGVFPSIPPFIPLADGTYSVTATIIDAAGNSRDDVTDRELVIDTIPPAKPTVSPLVTNNQRPLLSGTAALGAGERLDVTVAGSTFGGVPVIAGIWVLDTAIMPSIPVFTPLADGTYDVVAVVTDLGGNPAFDTTTNELVVDTTPPVTPTVNPLTTRVRKPTITGTAVIGAGDRLVVRVNGFTFTGATIGSGVWSLDTAQVAPTFGTFTDLAEGTYDVVATVSDIFGNAAADATTNELTIDLTPPPAPTVNRVLTRLGKPVISGTATLGAGDELQVVLNGFTFPKPVTVIAGGWSIDTATVAGFTSLPDGTYDITATATDAIGNSINDATTGELTVDSTAPGAPLLALGPGVSNPVSRPEATQAGGVITVLAEPASTVTVTFRGAVGSVVRTLTGTGSAQAITLSDGPGGDVSVLGDGLVTVTATQVDAVGNAQIAPSLILSFTLDATVPVVTALGVPVADGTVLTGGQSLDIVMTLSEPVAVNIAAGLPTLLLNTALGGQAVFVGVIDARTLLFRYTAAVGDSATALDVATSSALALNGAVITDTAGNPANLAVPVGTLAAKRIGVDGALRVTVGGAGNAPATAPTIRTAMRTLTVTFNAPVTGVQISAFKLYFATVPRRPGASPAFRVISLRRAAVSGSGSVYTLQLPANLTSLRGFYRLDIGGPGSGIRAGSVEMTTVSSLFWRRV